MEDAKLKKILKLLADASWALNTAMNDADMGGDSSTADWLEKQVTAVDSARTQLRKFRRMQKGAEG